MENIEIEEYKMLRKEIDDNIQKQDSLSTLIFSILGISFIFNNWFENALFLIVVMLISAVLLSKIIDCRKIVYYVSSYLLTDEGKRSCLWEKRIDSFKKNISKKDSILNNENKLINFIFKHAHIMKNLGNIILCSFVFVQILNLLKDSDDSMVVKVILLAFGVIAFLLNVIFTVTICIDVKIKEQYKQIWEEIIKEKE